MDTSTIPELENGERTEELFDKICFGEFITVNEPEDVAEGIKCAMELENRRVLAEGVAQRLNELGFECSPDDRSLIQKEICRRYKELVGKPCPRTVKEWINGTMPGDKNRMNNYELCFALELDYRSTAIFFQKYFLSMPYNVKSRTDAVFMYALYHKKSYADAAKMLSLAKGFVPQKESGTSTSRIFSDILSISSDDEFIKYLSEHCYDALQQFTLARSVIKKEAEEVRKRLLKLQPDRVISEARMNSLTLHELLGFSYQTDRISFKNHVLPKAFTTSLPNDTSFGKILNDETVSYELMRKTLILLKFYNFYQDADNTDVCSNLMDFIEELNGNLVECGFAQLYMRHPFDCLMLYCANTDDPIFALATVIQSCRE